MPDVMFYQSFSEKLLGGKLHLLDQCHEVQKLRKEDQQRPDRRYTQSQTRHTPYKKPNEVGAGEIIRRPIYFHAGDSTATEREEICSKTKEQRKEEVPKETQ